VQNTIKNILLKYAKELQEIGDTHLKSIILYNSYARGGFIPDLDIDLLLMPIVKSIDHFQYWVETYPFYSNIKKEGVSLYAA